MNYELVNGDTDGLAIKKPDGKPFSEEEYNRIINDLNSKMPELIRWEYDGLYKRVVVVKTKNYVIQDEKGKITIKGSALKASNKEPALKRFIQDVIDLLITDKRDQLFNLYNKTAKDILSITDIRDWCTKKTVTNAILTNTRTNEARVREAIGNKPVQEGDKIYVFFKTPTELCLAENFDGIYNVDTLLGKLYDTLCVFETIIDTSLFPNYSLKRNRDLI